MQIQLLRIGTLGVSALLMSGAVRAQEFSGTREELVGQLELMQQQLTEQKKLLESLRQSVTEQKASMIELRDTVSGDVLARHRGTGPQSMDATEAVNGDASPPPAPDAANGDASPPPAPATVAQAPAPTQAPVAVGQAPTNDGRPPEVAPLFEQPGVLTPKGKFVLEPSLQYGYSSSDQVALIGYTIIPALLIGLIDIQQVKVSTTTAALTLRYGLGRRFEVEAKVPYAYSTNSTLSRPQSTGSAVDTVFQTSGQGIGDVELAARYQLNEGGMDKSYYVAGLRVKTRTGRDPFSVVTDCTVSCVANNATGTGLPLTLPTGSGFYGVQPSLTWLFPSDPAVFFGSVSYLYSIARNNVSTLVLNGVEAPLGRIAPGGVIGFNFGMGLALNDKSALSIGYDHHSIGRTLQNDVPAQGSVRLQLGTLLVGYSYRISEKTTLNVSVGAGLTADTPGVTLTVRLPMTF